MLFIVPTNPLFGLVGGLATGLAIPLMDAILANRRYLKLSWYSFRYRNSNVRISVSYLFRIKLEGKYLLVKGRRRPGYQPVGGVYKITPGGKAFLGKIGALDDDLLPIDDISGDDLRIRVPAKNLVSFVRWFESGESRETSPWREFYEELIAPKILATAIFPYIYHEYIRREYRPLRFSTYAQSRELLIADIYELIPTPSQFDALSALQRSGHPDVLWAPEEQIRRRGAMPGRNHEIEIAEPAIWIM
ncbi:SMODS-associated NUDIX domain-containing protein [Nonomuraea sp. K271]|uniref:SMODS-associated NUDIX domain-containing protein n=1 Tax=Nonomuraea sp. K271 TaxID=1848319 RepID=UPI00191C45BA|nr:hypothetical protein [Nonomuraea sp. K271]